MEVGENIGEGSRLVSFEHFIKKMCIMPAYAVAIRRVGSGASYRIKYPTNREWWADPFVCSWRGKSYVFVEKMDSYAIHGEIAVAEVIDDRIGDFQTIIKESFHMSFPNVFIWNDEWYMLPETNMSQQVRLYKAEAFPYKWKLECILLADVRLVDHALYPTEKGFFVVSNDITDEKKAFNRCFQFNIDECSFEEFNPRGSWSSGRPGGTFYQEGEKWYHAIQDGIKTYGDYLHFYQVDTFTEELFEERETHQWHVEDVPYANSNGKLNHIHTYNRNIDYEVIDIQYDKVYLNKFVIHQCHEILKWRKRR